MRINSIIAVIGLLSILAASCENVKENTALFQSVTPQNSGLYFTNALTENDSINILDNEFVSFFKKKTVFFFKNKGY